MDQSTSRKRLEEAEAIDSLREAISTNDELSFAKIMESRNDWASMLSSGAARTCIISAANVGNLTMLRRLHLAGADLEANTSSQGSGLTPLTSSVHAGHVDCLRYLISTGANLEARDGLGRSACFIAASNRQLECLVALVEAGVNIEAVDQSGASVAVAAAANCNEPGLRVLALAGADLDRVCEGAYQIGESARSLALKRMGSPSLCAFLERVSLEREVGCAEPGSQKIARLRI